MKRLISGAEAVRAFIAPGLFEGELLPGGGSSVRHAPTLAALEAEPNRDAYRLWRSRDGYRKACRMLRRSGRRIKTAAWKRLRRAILETRAEALQVAFPPSYVSPTNSLLLALTARKE